MKLINNFIAVLSIIIILSFSYLGSITENATTMAQEYAKQSSTDAISAGFSKGFTGSGTLVADMSANPLAKYDQNNYNVEYHDPPEEIIKDTDSIIQFNEVTVFDPSLNRMVILPFSEQAGSPIYYEPNSKPYGYKQYIPDYESSVYLSRTNKLIR